VTNFPLKEAAAPFSRRNGRDRNIENPTSRFLRAFQRQGLGTNNSRALPLIESVRYELRIRLSVFERKKPAYVLSNHKRTLYIESLRFFDTGE